jgi:hypothetical protein
MRWGGGGGGNRIAVGYVEFDHDAAFRLRHHQYALLNSPLAESVGYLLDLTTDGKIVVRN